MDAFVLTLLGVVLLTIEHALPPIFGSVPNLAIGVVLVLAWRRPDMLGAAAALLLGYLADLFSGAPPGASAFATVAVFAAAKPVLEIVELRGLWRPALIGAFAASASVLLAAAARWAIAGGSMAGALSVVAPRAALTAVAAPAIVFLAVRLQTSLGPAAGRRDPAGARRRATIDLPLR